MPTSQISLTILALICMLAGAACGAFSDAGSEPIMPEAATIPNTPVNPSGAKVAQATPRQPEQAAQAAIVTPSKPPHTPPSAAVMPTDPLSPAVVPIAPAQPIEQHAQGGQATQKQMGAQTSPGGPAHGAPQGGPVLGRSGTQMDMADEAERGGRPPGRHLGIAPSQPTDTTFKEYPRSPVVLAAEDAMSTFSLDTDRTSFQLALNWARAGFEIEPASVRAEEWTNAFSYGYPAQENQHEFSIFSDIIEHPLDANKLLARLAFIAPEVSERRRLNVTLVLDASGSMGDGNRVAIARAAAGSIQDSLDEGDSLSVVHFTDYVLNEYTVVDASHNSEEARMSIAIASRTAPRTCKRG